MSYQREIWHNGLGERRIVKAPTPYEVNVKVEQQFARWETKWSKIVARQTGEEAAESRTLEAQSRLEGLRTLLEREAVQPQGMNWKGFAEVEAFTKAPPKRPGKPKLPSAPDPSGFKPRSGLFTGRRRREAEQRKARAAYDETRKAHRGEVERLKKEYYRQIASYERQEKEWAEARSAHDVAVKRRHAELAQLQQSLARREPLALAETADWTLSSLDSDPSLPHDAQVKVLEDGKTIGVRLQLPAPPDLPTLESVSYLVTKGEFREKHLPKTAQKQLYDSVVYQMVLRAAAAIIRSLQLPDDFAVVVNGMVYHVDPATGQDSEFCIASMQVSSADLRDIDLARVDAKECFRALKGVGSSSMHALAAVAPIQVLDRQDSRFVDALDAPAIDESTNLAAMDWKDFEHLVRTVFEQEFASGGGEVKVTQASRDGGIDAVAFDPDPIRGGKIVIQAKRYVNVVGVSAVRDLYGAVQHEGAMKGILVTTSTFGPDAFKWATGKPLQLLDGSNLLHLLERHGHKARIDRQEARRELGLKGSQGSKAY